MLITIKYFTRVGKISKLSAILQFVTVAIAVSGVVPHVNHNLIPLSKQWMIPSISQSPEGEEGEVPEAQPLN